MSAARELGMRPSEATALTGWAEVAVSTGDPSARSWLDAALAIHRELGDTAGAEGVLSRIGALP